MATWTAGNSLGSAEATAPGTSTKEREFEAARMWPGAVVANTGDSNPDLGTVIQTGRSHMLVARSRPVASVA